MRPEDLVSAEAKAVASQADAVVLAVGFNQDIEGESADRMFVLPPGQDELINQIAAANKNTVVVVTSGGGVDMTPWVDHVPAIFEAWFPGQEGGAALAQLLFGEFSPSGKLPMTFDRRWEENPAHDTYYPKSGDKKVAYTEGVFVGYRGYDKSGVKPLFPFGYGLSYTTFAYKNLTVSPATSAGSRSRCTLKSPIPEVVQARRSRRSTSATAIPACPVRRKNSRDSPKSAWLQARPGKSQSSSTAAPLPTTTSRNMTGQSSPAISMCTSRARRRRSS